MENERGVGWRHSYLVRRVAADLVADMGCPIRLRCPIQIRNQTENDKRMFSDGDGAFIGVIRETYFVS